VTSLFIGSVLLGAVLGRFFTVWVLVPVCAVAFVIVSVSYVFYGQGLLAAILEFVLVATGLQMGYGSGLLSFIILGARPQKPDESSRPAASMAAPRHHNRAA
jgi:hypothetical protein